MATVTTDLVQQSPRGAQQAPVVIAVNADGSPISGGGGGGVSEVTVTNFPATQPVSGTVTATGPLTNAQLTAVQGTAAVVAWPGTGSGTTIAILKAIHAQNEIMIGHLATIATNTTPAEAAA